MNLEYIYVNTATGNPHYGQLYAIEHNDNGQVHIYQDGYREELGNNTINVLFSDWHTSINQYNLVSETQNIKNDQVNGSSTSNQPINLNLDQVSIHDNEQQSIVSSNNLSVKIESSKFYTVQPGDTLNGIAVSNKIKLDELIRLNPQIKSNPDLLFAGEKIRIA